MIEPRRNKFYDLDKSQQSALMDAVIFASSRSYRAYHDLLGLLDGHDIVIAYNWPGHRGEFFAPTEEEMENHIDYIFQCRED